MMLRYVCQFLTRKSWTGLKLSIWKITAFRMNQLRFWCSLTTLVFNVGWAAQISGAGVIFGCLGSKHDWFEWISSICCDLTFFLVVISPKFGYLHVIWWLGRESLSKLSSLELNWRFGKKYTSPRFPGRASLCLVHLLHVGAKWFSGKSRLAKDRHVR